MQKKITKATFKSFIKKNRQNLFIRKRASFDGMTDGLGWTKNAQFKPIEEGDAHEEHTLGIKGVWLVGSSRDYFKPYDDGDFIGIEVSNCCGYFEVGIRK